MRHQIQLFAMLLCLGIVWGLTFSLIKFAAVSGLPYTTIALLVILGNMVIFGTFSVILTGRLRLPFDRVLFFAGCGILGYLLPFFLELFAVPKLGAGTLALMVSLAPITTVLLAAAPLVLCSVAARSLRLPCPGSTNCRAGSAWRFWPVSLFR